MMEEGKYLQDAQFELSLYRRGISFQTSIFFFQGSRNGRNKRVLKDTAIGTRVQDVVGAVTRGRRMGSDSADQAES
jgi:hypothetical protein